MKHNTVASIIETSCASKADAEFIADESHRLTGQELWSHISTVAAGFQNLGLQKGDVVAFFCGSSVAHTVTFFACLVSGVIPCCLHVRETQERNRDNILFVSANKIFADPALAEEAADLIDGDNVITLWNDFDKKISFDLPNLAPDDPALILISSGTAGAPKCILHSQSTLAATAEYGPYSYDCWSSEDSAIIIMAPSFAAWIHTVLPFIFIQGRIVFGAEFDPATFLKTLEQEKITLAPLVPTVWRMVIAAGPENYDLTHLKTAFFSGEPGSVGLIDDLQAKICPNVMTSYLASEGGCASGVIAGSDILSIFGQANSTGMAVKDADIQIMDPEGAFGKTLPPGEIGEIALKSSSIAVGYFGDTKLSREKFNAGWWRSGDLGWIGEKGLLYVKGRLDNRINTGGIKVYAEEVEAALLKHPSVQLAAVIGVPDEKWGQRVEAHIVAPNNPPAADDLRDFCKAEGLLPKTHLPKEIYIHDVLPTGPTGKLYRRGLQS